MISLNIEKTFGFISKASVAAYEAQVKAAQEALENGTGKGNDFLGWLHLPSSITKAELDDINATAKVLKENCEVVENFFNECHLIFGTDLQLLSLEASSIGKYKFNVCFDFKSC